MKRSLTSFTAIAVLAMTGCATQGKDGSAPTAGDHLNSFIAGATDVVSKTVEVVAKDFQKTNFTLGPSGPERTEDGVILSGRATSSGKPLNPGGKKKKLLGFRELKWGDAPTDNMVKVGTVDTFDIYKVNNSDNSIGRASLSAIHYRYLDDKLHSVVLETADFDNGDALLQALDSTFGKGLQPDNGNVHPSNASYVTSNSRYAAQTNVWYWDKHSGWIDMRCQEGGSPVCSATLISKVEYANEIKKKQSAANNAVSDF
ncbi:hypothetical protein NUW46_15560 [Marinobacter sp. MA]|uniref:hypothetical protein n=1 Tax=Marinobacter sp. MA TaxID=2971606 RepID=UPI003AAC7963